jgi:hypothetical protein
VFRRLTGLLRSRWRTGGHSLLPFWAAATVYVAGQRAVDHPLVHAQGDGHYVYMWARARQLPLSLQTRPMSRPLVRQAATVERLMPRLAMIWLVVSQPAASKRSLRLLRLAEARAHRMLIGSKGWPAAVILASQRFCQKRAFGSARCQRRASRKIQGSTCSTVRSRPFRVRIQLRIASSPKRWRSRRSWRGPPYASTCSADQ